MSTVNETKINQLLNLQPAGVVLTSAWLSEHGYSYDLLRKYVKNNWLSSIGRGAHIRHGDSVGYLGGIYALQSQLGLSVHPAAKTALALLGKSHYLELAPKRVQLFSTRNEKLPAWYKKYDWPIKWSCKYTDFLPPDLGLVNYESRNFEVKVSNPARAIMECLYLAPKSQPLLEVYELMEGLNNLRPKTVQELLENCTSVKVKRLFLYMADKARHSWLPLINLDKVDLGKGKRSIVSDGTYISDYQLVVPKELEGLS
ncbi:type IV toxin-antitoxin system AbiEi family antitoxin [Kangiella sp. TOML190]|uniref:type IV toxin-antitoxin system AbiEi family antitoxin n=1 Tax=Kangiella sp. TOML190 TaxID=2931351 RepID=UPI00204012A0|nr:type IV toxin-antitoxin system AbiEi family antitoxin [Kangiella sp. TOML190]